MFRIAALLLIALLPLAAQRNYQQTNAPSAVCDATEVLACTTATQVANVTSGGINKEVDEQGTAGTVENVWRIGNGDPLSVCSWFESDDVSDTDWASGDWVVRLEITTADTQTWDSTHICRVSSDCSTVHATVGSDTSVGNDLSTTGVKTNTVSGSSQTANSSDLFLIVLGCQENQGHGNSDVGATYSQLIDTPLEAPEGGGRRRSLTGVVGE